MYAVPFEATRPATAGSSQAPHVSEMCQEEGTPHHLQEVRVMDLAPGGIIAWLIVGLIAGWAAGAVSRGHGFGIIGDIVVGLIGALVGGFLAGFLIHGSVGLIGSILIAFVGAVILLAIFRAIMGSRVRA